MGEIWSRPRPKRAVNHVSLVLSVACIAIFALTSVLPEMNTERYEHPSLTDYLPLASLIKRASGALYVASLVLSGAAILHALSCHFVSVRESSHHRRQSQVSVWVPYILAWFLSVGFGAVPGTSIYALVSVAMALAVASLLNRQYLGSRLDLLVKFSFRAVVGISLLLGVIAPGRAFAPYSVWPGGWFAGADRLQGVLPHPNTFAWICALAVVVELFAMRSRLGFLFAGSALVGLILSGSRTASMALAAGLLVAALYFVSRRNRTLKLLSWSLAPIFVVIIIVVASGEGVNASSFNGRQETWDAALRSFAQNWFLGSGPGAYLVADGVTANVPYAHNQILQTAAELGIVGLLALGVHLWAMWRFLRSHPKSVLLAVLVSMWIVMFISENLLRFAATGFYCQILFFQLALYLSTREADVTAGKPVGKNNIYV